MNWAASLFWLVLMVVFRLMEASTVTLVSIWLAAGSLAALIVGLFSGQIWLQVTLFLVVSCGTLIALRPLVRRFVTPKITATNVDCLIGSEGYVTVAIDNLAATGKIKLGPNTWTARSTSGDPIGEGTLVRVNRIEGVKAFVSPVKVEEPTVTI